MVIKLLTVLKFSEVDHEWLGMSSVAKKMQKKKAIYVLPLGKNMNPKHECSSEKN